MILEPWSNQVICAEKVESQGIPCPIRSTSWQEVAKQVSWVKGSQAQTVRQAWKRVGPGYWWVMMGPKSDVPSPNSQK